MRKAAQSKTAIDTLRFASDIAAVPLVAVVAALSWRYIEKIAPSSDGSGVLIIPGFRTSEKSLLPIKYFLGRKGFHAQSWGLGVNLGAPDAKGMTELVSRIQEKAEQLAKKTGRPIAVVGHSLGGILARAVAARKSDAIDRVVTIGSPLFMEPEHISSVNGLLVRAMERSGGRNLSCQAEDAAKLGFWDPLSVPLIAIQSPYDGFLNARLFHPREVDNRWIERINTVSTHCGMCLNPYTLLALADRLALTGDSWQPFDPDQYLRGFLRHGYLPVEDFSAEWQDDVAPLYPNVKTV